MIKSFDYIEIFKNKQHFIIIPPQNNEDIDQVVNNYFKNKDFKIGIMVIGKQQLGTLNEKFVEKIQKKDQNKVLCGQTKDLEKKIFKSVEFLLGSKNGGGGNHYYGFIKDNNNIFIINKSFINMKDYKTYSVSLKSVISDKISDLHSALCSDEVKTATIFDITDIFSFFDI